MIFQVTAYEMAGGLHVQVVRADVSAAGYSWTQMLNELVDLVPGGTEEPWDVVWLIGQKLSERALEAGKLQRDR